MPAKSIKRQTPADVNLALVLAAIKEIRETNQSAHKDIHDMINMGLKGVQLNIDTNATLTHEKLDSIDTRFATLNGTVGTLKKISDERAKVVEDFREHQRFGQWVHKNWWVVLLICVTFVTLIVVILDRLGLVGVLETVKEIKDVL